MDRGGASSSGFKSTTSMSSLTSTTRYGGLLEVPMHKQIKNSLFNLITYFDTAVPAIPALHAVIEFFRILQFLGPSFGGTYTALFPDGSKYSILSGIISIFYSIVPTFVQEKAYLGVLFAYFGIMALFYIVFVASAIYYRKTAKLPMAIAMILNIFIYTVGYLIHPIAGLMCGQVLTNLCYARYSGSEMVTYIVAAVLALCMFIIFFYLKSQVLSMSLIFRPGSLPTVVGSTQIKIFLFVNGVNLIFGIASKCEKFIAMGITAVGAIVYIASFIWINTGSSFYRTIDFHCFVGCTIAGVIDSIILIVYLILERQGDLVLFIMFVVSFIIGYFTAVLLLSYRQAKALELLDEIEENNDNFAKIKGYNHFTTLVAIGFMNNHNLCLTYDFFQIAIQNMEEDQIRILPIFAKFVAIYPDASKMLDMIQQKLVQSGLKSAQAKQTAHQIISITNERQNVLSPSLKKKINQAQKKEATAKRKLLTIWDLVIQGNVIELDAAVESSYKASNVAELELLRLRQEYPNNTFVARAYGRFMHDVRRNEAVVAIEQDKIRKLRRGIYVAVDKSNELGMLAFPNLPPTPPINIAQTDKNVGILESISGTELELEEEGVLESEQANNETVWNRINDVKIPSVRKSMQGYIFCCLVLVIMPSALLMGLSSVYIDSLYEPVPMMQSVSMIRLLVFQMTAFEMRMMVEALPDKDDPSQQLTGEKIELLYGYKPSAFSNRVTTSGQLKAIINDVAGTMENCNAIRDYMPGNVILDRVRDNLFQNTIRYQMYVTPTEYSEQEFSAIDSLMDITMACSKLVDKTLTVDDFVSMEYLNPQNNVMRVANALSSALTDFITYIQEFDAFYQKLFLGLQIGLSVVTAALIFFFQYYAIKRTKHDTLQVYKCLTVLPKAVVSQAADAQRLVKKDTNTNGSNGNVELNKQEESLIKVFMSASDSSSSVSVMAITECVATFICIVLVVLSINLCFEAYKSRSSSIIESAPHIDYVLGTAAYMSGTFTSLIAIACANDKYSEIDPDPYSLLSRVDSRLNTMSNYYTKMRYGGSLSGELPFGGFEEAFQKADELYMCDDVNAFPTSYMETYSCADKEFHMNLLTSWIYKIMTRYNTSYIDSPYSADCNASLLVDDEILNNAWYLGQIIIYDTLLYPMFNSIFTIIRSDLTSDTTNTMLQSSACIVLASLCIIYIVREIFEQEKRIKYTISLLLHVDLQVALNTPKIVAILSGNFNDSDRDTSTRSVHFFEQVVDKLIDCVVLTDEKGQIISMNQITLKSFNVSAEDFIGQDIHKFFDKEHFQEGDVSKVVDEVARDPVLLRSNDKYFSTSVLQLKNMMVYSMKNDTARINHSQLIAEERAKSDKMLSSILPAALVPRVQAGESNISFAVQSASVLFLDIVSFTPWCGSNQAAYVMKVLNRLFKDLDRLLPEFPTLTKIKCIGDCYMAAGGIFSEVNQPAVHAKEMVEFGLRAIEVVETIDKDLGEKLQIRVGVNTGGPLVAGVLGTAKPTFEILGPVINMAQQMEHHGVPMAVHISRATYELIYGSSFNIKERGQVEVKSGKVNTYLVTK